MAIGNMLREPRREITESLVGLAIVAVPVWADYRFAVWLQRATGDCPWPAGMLLGLLGAIIVFVATGLVVFGTHALGETVCNALQRKGVHLRPRQRY